ncbi:MAG: hypothetical protein KAW12_00345 [Candidatus Aminicenantes bacterium]|nr:hypothetical protein [Candidatus Aminicenantes bacterium]
MNDNQNEENKKVILLDLSRTERAFEDDESLWDIEIGKIEERLAAHIESLEEYKDEKDVRKKPLLSIAILGYPGSGKTSMLHTLVDLVNREKPGKKLLDNVYSLPMIKPNLVAEGDHFLYAFLAEALRADRKQHQNEEDRDNDRQFISRVQHKFQEVSEYLQVLNKTGQKHEGDPLGVSLERLDRHESGLMLIEKMAGFIDELAISLGGIAQSSIVLLPVDDADMSKEVLDSALDTCWRFIKHPRLVPIFTFSGRLAEELLRVKYDEKLNSGSSLEELKETSTSMLVTENMAIQHLGKLFPVRNRIKMGLASARVQVAKYKPLKKESEKKDVSELLKTASELLFGHAHVPIVHSIRPPLRVVTLRRQIQIIDAIQGTGIEYFMQETETDKKKGKKEQESKSWAEIFDLAAWSLLNAHRDVLKEIDLNLDDLYGWTPKGLRQVVLDSILSQSLDDRGKLLKHWRYRTEDRRSQIISLLAVNVFRPRMDEEPTGDDSIDVIKRWWEEYPKNKDEGSGKDRRSFSILAGTQWFLNLCVGCYLPQVLAWKRLSKTGETGDKEKSNRVTGIGWDSLSGPTHAVREAIHNKKVFSSGILFLEPEEFNTQLNDYTANKNKRFIFHVWCSYGFHDGWPWAAISLWRGLGLIAKVIEFYEAHREYAFDDDKNKNKKKNELIDGISKIIRKHFRMALVSSNLPTGEKIERFDEFNFADWEYKEENKYDPDSMENKIPLFAAAIISWLEKNCSDPKKDNNGNERWPEESRISPMENDDWESSFIRRLHGENLMSIFWQDLDNAYYKKKLKEWTAGLILYRWKKLLSKYWKGCDQVKDLLESCPIWPDFESHVLYKKCSENGPKFDWGAVKVLPLEEYVKELEEPVDVDRAGVETLTGHRKGYKDALEKAYIGKRNVAVLNKLSVEHKKEKEEGFIKKLEEVVDKDKKDEEGLKKLKKKYEEKREEAVDKDNAGVEAFTTLRKEYIEKLEEAVTNKKNDEEKVFKNLKKNHEIEFEAIYKEA